MLEVAIASTILVLVMSGVLGTLNTSARLEQSVLLQQDTDQKAALAMSRMVADVREAKQVEVLSPWRYRIFYPVKRPDGNYDRFVVDPGSYVEYTRATKNGQPSATGTYIWRFTPTHGIPIADHVAELAVALQGKNAVRLSIRVQKQGKGRQGDTRLNERVLYLRNY
jgi:hypothetical protein